MQAPSQFELLRSPVELGSMKLPHRMVMAPMTRSRAAVPGDVPTELNARYYAQRASAALIISEATRISAEAKGYALTPGLHTREQVEGWSLVTRTVHEAGGRIFAQLWHVGRVSHRLLQPGGQLPVAPSAIAPRGVKVYVTDPHTGASSFVACETPRALERDEIHRIVADYRRAARLAMEAGFDGVELHGANGYLIDQFLRSTTNLRRDEYGSDALGRIRFLHEVAHAVCDEIGPQRVGVRLSPHVTLMDMADPDIESTTLLAASLLDELGIAYLHLCEADWDDAPIVPLVEYADASAEVRAVYDDIMATRKSDWVNNFWKVLAHDPANLKRTWEALKVVMGPGALDPLTKELIYIAVSATNGCEYCTYSHTASARAKGMTDAMLMEVLAVAAKANETNRLANALRPPVDPQFLPKQ